MIGVKNRGKTKLEARYDGVEYKFPSDEKVVTPIPEDACRHIFGYGERDKTRALQRLGWLRTGGPDVLAEAIEKLNEFQFLQVEMTVKDTSGADLPRNLRPEESGVPAKQIAASPEGADKQFARK